MIPSRTFVPVLFLLAACDGGGASAPDARSFPDAREPGLDASRPDAARPDTGPFLCHASDAGGLGALEGLCADLVAGESELELRSRTRCGEPLTLEDMPHLLLSPVEGCEGTRRAADLRRVAASLAAGRVALDEASRVACRELGRSTDAGPYVDGGLVAPCDRIVVGQVAPGSACDYDEECAQGLCECQAEGSCQGRCVALPPLHAPCRAPGLRCEGGYCQATDAGLRCEPLVQGCPLGCATNETCSAGVCVRLPQPGEPCSGDCAQGSTCVGRTDAGSGLCQPHGQVGERCASDGTAPRCADCLRCDPKSRRCRPAARTGDPCGADAGDCEATDLTGVFYCAPSGTCAVRPRRGEPCSDRAPCLFRTDHCRREADAGTGICTAQPRLCEPCLAGGARLPCAEGECHPTAGVCAPAAQVGADCRELTCAAGLFCDFGVCAALPSRANADCLPAGRCTGGFFCGGTPDGGPRRCEPQRLGGASCERGEQCLSESCDEATRQCLGGVPPEQRLATGCWLGSAFEYFGYLTFFALAAQRRRRR